MESCPKVEIENFKSVLKEVNLYLRTEVGEQGRLPVLILNMKEWEEKRPVIVILYSTHKNKEYLRPLLEANASRGYVGIAIDARYHWRTSQQFDYLSRCSCIGMENWRAWMKKN